MKILVTYMSQTGNTKKVAEAIYQEIKGKKEIKPMSEVSSLAGYDLAFVGLPIQAYGPGAEGKSFLEQHSKGRNIALFITHASPEEQPELKEWLGKCKAAAVGANIVGIFNCRGELSQAIADFMSNSGDPALAAWAKERPDTLGQPDAARLKKARTFAREIMKKHSRG
ncbi:MAG: flavodoxin [Chloroflexi bacterium]|nr:flavodoxin [Chloroflexota bacterium]